MELTLTHADPISNALSFIIDFITASCVAPLSPSKLTETMF